MKTKTAKLTSQGFATNGGVFIGESLSGQVNAQPDVLSLPPPSRIVSMKLPGAVFGRGGKIQYAGQNSVNAIM